MKRGLVVLDHEEVRADEWASRIRKLQEQVRAAGVDIALIYNDVSRGDDIGYLTNLVIYWNEGVLAVPAEGDAALLTKLSKRVHSWMQKTSNLTDLRSGRTFGDLVSAYVADRPAGTIGFVDAQLWPASIIKEINAAVPEWKTVNLGPLVRDSRALPSPAELELLRTGARVLRDALAAATANGLEARERVAALELTARRGGFADVLFRTADEAGHVTVEAAGEYRHGWLLIGRTFGAEAWLPTLVEAHHAALRAVRAGVDWADVETAASGILAALPAGAVPTLRWISQADFATGGELQPPPTAGPSDGEVIGVVLEVIDPDGRRSVLGDTVLVTAEGTEPLTY
jgi:Xaa-Pro aminopeptidase